MLVTLPTLQKRRLCILELNDEDDDDATMMNDVDAMMNYAAMMNYDTMMNDYAMISSSSCKKKRYQLQQ